VNGTEASMDATHRLTERNQVFLLFMGRTPNQIRISIHVRGAEYPRLCGLCVFAG
jgi:hypothetical protein